ncbi:perforin-1-like protein, partial [Lates japonicus]
MNTYTTQDIPDWKVGLNVDKFVGGTRSSVYKFAIDKAREDRYTFSTHSVTCRHYRYRVANEPPLSPEFSKDLTRLPSSYSSTTRAQYNKFIRTYGTHYIRQVDLGGRLRRITAARTCLSTLNGFTSHKVSDCLSVGFSVGLGKLESPNDGSCSRVLQNRDVTTSYGSGLHRHYTEVTGGTGWMGEFSLTRDDSQGYKTWLETLKNHPDIVEYSLGPMYELMPYAAQRAGMKAAIEQYLEDNAARTSRRERDCGWNLSNLAPNCCPLTPRKGMLEVTRIQAWDLYGDVWGTTDSYVKMSIGFALRRTEVVESDNPRWSTQYDLGTVDTSLGLKVEVWDEDPEHDDLLGSCKVPLYRGSYRVTCSADSGRFEVQYTLTCDPNLTGDKCHLYKPSP